MLRIVWQCSWGGLQTLLGALLFLLHFREERSLYRGEVVVRWKYRSSVSLGLFLFLSRSDAPPRGRAGRLLVHEYGHSVQSLLLGPLYLPAVGLPSLLWASLGKGLRRRKNLSYYSFYTERWADSLGQRATGEAIG